MMTISSANALPLAASPADLTLEAAFSDTLELMSSDSALAAENSFPDGFQALLDEQMATPGEDLEQAGLLFSNDVPADSSETEQTRLQSLFEAMQAESKAPLDGAAEAGIAASVVAPGFNADGGQQDDGVFGAASGVALVSNPDVPDKAGADTSLEDRKLTPDDPAVEPVAVAGIAPALAPQAENDGELLPSTRQMAAPAVSAADPAAVAVVPRTAADIALTRDKAISADSRTLIENDASAEHQDESESDMSAQKEVTQRAAHEAKTNETLLARQETAQPAGLPAREAGGLGVQGEFNTVAMMQAQNSPSTPQPLNPAAHSLQLAPQASAAQWGEALGEKVTLLISHKLQSAEMRIDPPHLGKLDIQIQLKDDSATINIQTHQAATRDMIDAASFRLREFLQDSGYSAVDVNVSHREQSMAQQDSGEGRSQGDQQANEMTTDSVTTHTAWQASASEQMVLSNGVIDYFA